MTLRTKRRLAAGVLAVAVLAALYSYAGTAMAASLQGAGHRIAISVYLATFLISVAGAIAAAWWWRRLRRSPHPVTHR